MIKAIFEKGCYLLMALYLVGLTGSVAFMEVGTTFLFGSAILYSVYLYFSKENLVLHWKTPIIFLPFFVYLILVSYNKESGADFLHSIGIYRWYLLVLVVPWGIKLLEDKSFDWKLLVYFFCIGVSIYSIYKSLNLERGFSNFNLSGLERTTGTFSNALTFGGVYVYLLILMVSDLMYGERTDRWRSVFVKLCLVMSLGAFILSFSRGPWISFILCVLSMSFFKGKKVFCKSLVAIMVTGVVSALIFPQLQDRILNVFNSSTQWSNLGRIALWEAYWKIFLDYPFFGAGINASGYLLPDYFEANAQVKINSHAHNSVLTLLSGIGLVGTSIYFAAFSLVFKYYRHVISNFKKLESGDKILINFSVFGFLSFLVSGLTESVVLDAESMHLHSFSISCLVYVYMKNTSTGIFFHSNK